MKCKGKEHFGKDAKTIVAESTGKKGLYGEAIWMDEDGNYYTRRNSGHHKLARKMTWVFDRISEDYVKQYAH